MSRCSSRCGSSDGMEGQPRSVVSRQLLRLGQRVCWCWSGTSFMLLRGAWSTFGTSGAPAGWRESKEVLGPKNRARVKSCWPTSLIGINGQSRDRSTGTFTPPCRCGAQGCRTGPASSSRPHGPQASHTSTQRLRVKDRASHPGPYGRSPRVSAAFSGAVSAWWFGAGGGRRTAQCGPSQR